MNVHVSPSSVSVGKQFTKAQIAEITRGAKVVALAKPKTDPVIALVKEADAALERYIVALNGLNAAKEKLSKHDQGWPMVGPIDEMIHEWHHGHRFSSEPGIDKAFANRRKMYLEVLKGNRAKLKSWRSGHGVAQIRLELQQGIDRAKRVLANLPKWRAPMKKAFRAEVRRLAKVQRAVGLEQKRHAWSDAWCALWELTSQIRKASPRTIEGALALLAYVALRNRDDLAGIFSENGVTPAGLHSILERARLFLVTEIVRRQ